MTESTRVYVDMVGDLFHAGHVALLRAARALGDELVVGVLSDETATAYKRRPIMTLDERVAVIEACRHVDEVIADAPDRLTHEFLEEHQLDLVVHGDDIDPGTRGVPSCCRIRAAPPGATDRRHLDDGADRPGAHPVRVTPGAPDKVDWCVLAALAPAGVSVSHPKARTSTSTQTGSTPLAAGQRPVAAISGAVPSFRGGLMERRLAWRGAAPPVPGVADGGESP